MAMLDMIITHHRERWSECRKMFEMLKMQRGIRGDEFRVILVQDGEESGLDMGRILKSYPFVEKIISLPGNGVSAARNAGLEAAEAEWVMFCDCDDCLYSVDSLFRILQSIRESESKADMLWSSIWIEMRKKDGSYCKTLKEWNNVFIHGKVFRRSFLADNGIRFSTRLSYSEDAMFCSLVAMEILPSRIGKMPEVVYMWCYREESLSNYTGGEADRMRSLAIKRKMLPQEYEKRGMGYEAKTAAARALMDYYWESEGGGWPEDIPEEEWWGYIHEILTIWPDCITDITPGERKELYRITREESISKGHIREGMKTMQEWMQEVGALRKTRAAE